MKKILFIFALLFVICSPFAAAEETDAAAEEPLPNIQFELRDYDGIQLDTGTFIPVMNTTEVSTQNCPEGFKTMFIATNDMYMEEVNVIPKDTVFYGRVEDLHEPVIGTNGSMKIRIVKMVYPDGFEVPVRGYIYSNNNNILGGEMAPPEKYVRMPHYQTRYYALTLQLRPGRERQMGVHTTLRAGENKLIILTDPVWITHTMTN